MKINKVFYEKLFPTGSFLNERIGLEASLDPGDDEQGVLEWLKEKVEKFHKDSNLVPFDEIPINRPSNELPTINRAEERVEADQAFQQLKETLENIKYREEAQAYLDGTDFKHTIEAKKIVNKKPNKPVV